MSGKKWLLIIVLVIVALAIWYFYYSPSAIAAKATTPAPAAVMSSLPQNGTAGETTTVNGTTYTWQVNGVNGFTGTTGWKYNAA